MNVIVKHLPCTTAGIVSVPAMKNEDGKWVPQPLALKGTVLDQGGEYLSRTMTSNWMVKFTVPIRKVDLEKAARGTGVYASRNKGQVEQVKVCLFQLTPVQEIINRFVNAKTVYIDTVVNAIREEAALEIRKNVLKRKVGQHGIYHKWQCDNSLEFGTMKVGPWYARMMAFFMSMDAETSKAANDLKKDPELLTGTLRRNTRYPVGSGLHCRGLRIVVDPTLGSMESVFVSAATAKSYAGDFDGDGTMSSFGENDFTVADAVQKIKANKEFGFERFKKSDSLRVNCEAEGVAIQDFKVSSYIANDWYGFLTKDLIGLVVNGIEKLAILCAVRMTAEEIATKAQSMVDSMGKKGVEIEKALRRYLENPGHKTKYTLAAQVVLECTLEILENVFDARKGKDMSYSVDQWCKALEGRCDFQWEGMEKNEELRPHVPFLMDLVGHAWSEDADGNPVFGLTGAVKYLGDLHYVLFIKDTWKTDDAGLVNVAAKYGLGAVIDTVQGSGPIWDPIMNGLPSGSGESYVPYKRDFPKKATKLGRKAFKVSVKTMEDANRFIAERCGLNFILKDIGLSEATVKAYEIPTQYSLEHDDVTKELFVVAPYIYNQRRVVGQYDIQKMPGGHLVHTEGSQYGCFFPLAISHMRGSDRPYAFFHPQDREGYIEDMTAEERKDHYKNFVWTELEDKGFYGNNLYGQMAEEVVQCFWECFSPLNKDAEKFKAVIRCRFEGRKLPGFLWHYWKECFENITPQETQEILGALKGLPRKIASRLSGLLTSGERVNSLGAIAMKDAIDVQVGRCYEARIDTAVRLYEAGVDVMACSKSKPTQRFWFKDAKLGVPTIVAQADVFHESLFPRRSYREIVAMMRHLLPFNEPSNLGQRRSHIPVLEELKDYTRTVWISIFDCDENAGGGDNIGMTPKGMRSMSTSWAKMKKGVTQDEFDARKGKLSEYQLLCLEQKGGKLSENLNQVTYSYPDKKGPEEFTTGCKIVNGKIKAYGQPCEELFVSHNPNLGGADVEVALADGIVQEIELHIAADTVKAKKSPLALHVVMNREGYVPEEGEDPTMTIQNVERILEDKGYDKRGYMYHYGQEGGIMFPILDKDGNHLMAPAGPDDVYRPSDTDEASFKEGLESLHTLQALLGEYVTLDEEKANFIQTMASEAERLEKLNLQLKEEARAKACQREVQGPQHYQGRWVAAVPKVTTEYDDILETIASEEKMAKLASEFKPLDNPHSEDWY